MHVIPRALTFSALTLTLTAGALFLPAITATGTGTATAKTTAAAWANNDDPVTPGLPPEVWGNIVHQSLSGVNPTSPTTLQQVSKGFRANVFGEPLYEQVQAFYDYYFAALSDEELEERKNALDVLPLSPEVKRLLRTAIARSPIYGFAGAHGKGNALGDASTTQLNGPHGMVWDEKNDRLLISDTLNNRVLAFSSDGEVSLFAGTGEEHLGKTARETKLHSPTGIAIDPVSGNVFFTDTLNNRVLCVEPNGVISRFAGTDTGVEGAHLGSTATTTQLNSPSGVAIDPNSGDVLITDTFNHRVLAVSPGGAIRRFAGTGESGHELRGTAPTSDLHSPSGIAIDPTTGNVLFIDAENHRVLTVTPSGTISVLAGIGEPSDQVGMTATTTGLSVPRDVTVDRAGNIFIADFYNNRVLLIAPGGNVRVLINAKEIAENVDQERAEKSLPLHPISIAVDDKTGFLYIGDYSRHRILTKWHGNEAVHKLNQPTKSSLAGKPFS